MVNLELIMKKVDRMSVEVYRGDITKLNVEAIVNPADSYISMGGGLAKRILELGGEIIRREAQKYAPVKVGEAIVTTAGDLPAKYVIHAPTMERPGKTTVRNTKLAMNAILECAEKNDIGEIAVPGLGTGTGKVPYQDAARVMIDSVKNFKSRKIRKIIFVAYDKELYEVFKGEMEKL